MGLRSFINQVKNLEQDVDLLYSNNETHFLHLEDLEERLKAFEKVVVKAKKKVTK